MKRYKVRFTPEAEDDLLRLYDFLLEKDVVAAESALEAIKKKQSSYFVSRRSPAVRRYPTIRSSENSSSLLAPGDT